MAKKRVKSESNEWTVLEFLDAPNHAGGFDTFELFVSKAGAAGFLDEQSAWELTRAAQQRKLEAVSLLRRAKAFLEATYQIHRAIIQRHVPPSHDLETFNRELSRSMGHAELASSRARFTWSWRAGAKELDRALWPVVRAAAELLTSPELSRVRVCAADRCGRLFLDTSKNGSRRWCDMKVCGNRAKVRLHRRRRLDGEPATQPARVGVGRPARTTLRSRRDDSFID